ncbi:MAG: TonB-dependent receptor, partial [Candidatus Calescibacterium sp.]|nr:TonB-dependent receptor [Candidatus Calescibacterium sp.]
QEELFNDILPSVHSGIYILPGLKEYREKHNKGDWVLDGRIGYWATRYMRFSLIVNNLLNREYMGRPGDVQPPRNFAFSLNIKL